MSGSSKLKPQKPCNFHFYFLETSSSIQVRLQRWNKLLAWNKSKTRRHIWNNGFTNPLFPWEMGIKGGEHYHWPSLLRGDSVWAIAPQGKCQAKTCGLSDLREIWKFQVYLSSQSTELHRVPLELLMITCVWRNCDQRKNHKRTEEIILGDHILLSWCEKSQTTLFEDKRPEKRDPTKSQQQPPDMWQAILNQSLSIHQMTAAWWMTDPWRDQQQTTQPSLGKTNDPQSYEPT